VQRLCCIRAGATNLADIDSDSRLPRQQAASCLCWHIAGQAIANERPLWRNADVFFWVEKTRWRTAAYGHRTFNVGFLAMNPKVRLSQPDPLLPFRSLQSSRSWPPVLGQQRSYDRWANSRANDQLNSPPKTAIDQTRKQSFHSQVPWPASRKVPALQQPALSKDSLV